MSVASVGAIPVSTMTFPSEFAREAVRQETAPKHETKPQSHEPIHATASDLEQVSRVFNKKLQFVVDHSSHQVIVKVIDKETDKVIKELPPEELQRLHNSLKNTIGLLFDELV